MTGGVIGLPLAEALDVLKRAGISAPKLIQSRAPQGMTPCGTLRVTRAREGGRELTVSRFPDSIKPGLLEVDDIEQI